MQKRSYSARRINVAEKPGRLSGFPSLQPCSSQPEQNETDEPPSLFEPLNAGIRLYGLSRINTRTFRSVNSLPLLFFSKSLLLKGKKGFFFFASGCREKLFCDSADFFDPEQREDSHLAGADSVDEAATGSVPCGLTPPRRITDDCCEPQEEGFIVRDNSGRIKTIVFRKKRSS